VRALGQGPTVLECTLRFQRELLNRTPINVRSWVSSYVGKIARVHQEIQLESGGTACEADFVVGLFDTRARKLIDPTPEWLASVGLTPSDWQPSGPASG
jgi:acyl-CoA thioester hydrolase